MHSIQQEVLDIVQSKYRLLEIVDLFVYDCKLDELYALFKRYESHTFAFDERILILHHDTDYYASVDTGGFTIYNLVTILNKLNIPNEFIIMLTNHYGLQSEVQQQFNSMSGATAFKVIYTSQWYDFPKTITCREPTINKIESLYCCLNGKRRSHRVLLLATLNEHNLLDSGIISYHFGESND